VTTPLIVSTCVRCDTVLAADARFCTECGTPQHTGSPHVAPQHVVSHYAMHHGCMACGGDGHRLRADVVYCAQCRWLRPLAPAYAMDAEAFLWSLDAQAMVVLESLGPVTAAARALSDRVGRPWFETTVNGIRLSETQFPDIFTLGIRAARIMGLRVMPELYLSGEMLWDAMTLGSDEQAFIVIGSVLTYFKGDELLYVLGREMGHIRAGHVMWRTASKFLTGSTHMNRSVMGAGLLNALTPGKLLENAIDAPIMAWSRHSEISADRAGLLVVGDVEVARKVLMTSSLKSFPLFGRINQEEWLRQEATSDDHLMLLSEATLSTTPFLARRMRMLREFAEAPHAIAWRAYIDSVAPVPSVAPDPPRATAPVASARNAQPTAAPEDVVRFACRTCKSPIKVPRRAMVGKQVVRITCPSAACRTEMNVRPPRPDPRVARFSCVRCGTAVIVQRAQLAGKGVVKVRCPKTECRCVMDVSVDKAT
jgi:Zn-dependent protease with chaperone function